MEINQKFKEECIKKNAVVLRQHCQKEWLSDVDRARYSSWADDFEQQTKELEEKGYSGEA